MYGQSPAAILMVDFAAVVPDFTGDCGSGTVEPFCNEGKGHILDQISFDDGPVSQGEMFTHKSAPRLSNQTAKGIIL